MSELLYIDLLIENGDFSLNTGREPVLCHNRVLAHRRTQALSVRRVLSLTN